jgi:ligand-binding sensor domain-containing protein/two-component sensor histidine kinase
VLANDVTGGFALRFLACRAALFACLSLCAAIMLQAQQLPIKRYTTDDGLPHNSINKIVRDLRGFLWFCTGDGLSRFDGYTFTNYSTEQGLPHRVVTDFLETRAGEYWVGTYGGLVRFNPGAPPDRRVVVADKLEQATSMFAMLRPSNEATSAPAVTALFEDRDGTIWCGAQQGLYRVKREGPHFVLSPVEVGLPLSWPEGRIVSRVLEDRYGSLWIATPSGLYRRWPDGTFAHYTKRDGLPDEYLHDLLEDHQGQLWAGTRYGGFFRFNVDNTANPPKIARVYSTRDGLPTNWVFQLFESSDRHFWIASNRGLIAFAPETEGHSEAFHRYSEGNGLSYFDVTAANEDTGGNLWLGTNTAGAMRMERNGFVTYDRRDGLATVNSIFADRSGALCFRGDVIGHARAPGLQGANVDSIGPVQDYLHKRLGRLDGQRLNWLVPKAIRDLGWVGEGVTLQARNGDWWIGSEPGLYRFAAINRFDELKSAQPVTFFPKEEFGGNPVFRLFEDSRGDIWISSWSTRPLLLWDHVSEKLRDLSAAPTYHANDLPRSFGEDSSGKVWIGFNGEVARYDNGEFRVFSAPDGVPEGAIASIYADHAGRLWLASSRGGLIRVDEPKSAQPRFVNYTTAEGLSSNSIEPIGDLLVEDLQGRIYIGTARGLDRLDPTTGHFRHFTTADGLASGLFRAAFRDQNGGLWFGTSGGLSHFIPGRDERAETPPPILISNLSIAGAEHFVSAVGEREILLPELRSDQNQLQIDFVGLNFVPGEALRYQYKLEGADKDWSAPTYQRTVNYARLAPGRYRFLVQAINLDGLASSKPAVISFRILPPLWARWWSITSAAIALTFVFYGLYRYRVARLLELERVRTRIATDLHDDIGAGLSRIAVLSEVARHEASGPTVNDRLSVIASASRELVDSMSDIVWAINPQRDQLHDLTQRMRRFASDVFTSRNIEFRFSGPDDEHPLKVSADVRRQIFLIFKECINNIVRHSGSGSAEIELNVEDRFLRLTMKDDGHGFNPADISEGNGLANMRARMEMMGGKFHLMSANGRGTKISLEVPLKATINEHNGRLGERRK